MSDGTDSESVPGDPKHIQRGDRGSLNPPHLPSAADAELRAWITDQESRDGGRPEHLSRLLGDAELLTELQRSNFADTVWAPIASEFARYGLGVMSAWIRSRAIFERVKSRLAIELPSPPEGALDDDAIHDLATDTTVKSLQTFRDEVLLRGRWDPRRGASMKTFFVGQCLFQFPNIYRLWLRGWYRYVQEVHLTDDDVALDALAGTTPAADRLPLQRAAIHEVMSMIDHEVGRKAFLLTSLGYTQSQIAAALGLDGPKAVENMLGHQRRLLQRRASGRHGEAS